MRCLHFVGTVAVALTFGEYARAQDTPSEPVRSGLYAGASGGLGFDGARSKMSGVLLGPAAAIGYAPARGLALAVEGGLFVEPDQLAFARIGALIDAYPVANGPFHIQAGADFTTHNWATGELLDCTDAGCPTDAQKSLGFFAHAGAGYAWHVGRFDIGPLLDLYYARLGGRSAYGSGLVLSATWF